MMISVFAIFTCFTILAVSASTDTNFFGKELVKIFNVNNGGFLKQVDNDGLVILDHEEMDDAAFWQPICREDQGGQEICRFTNAKYGMILTARSDGHVSSESAILDSPGAQFQYWHLRLPTIIGQEMLLNLFNCGSKRRLALHQDKLIHSNSDSVDSDEWLIW